MQPPGTGIAFVLFFHPAPWTLNNRFQLIGVPVDLRML
jgi:hypothetical protein